MRQQNGRPEPEPPADLVVRLVVQSVYLAGVVAFAYNPPARWRWDQLFPEWVRRG